MSLMMRRSAALVRPLMDKRVRFLYSSATRMSSPNGANVVNADEGKMGTKLYHAVNLVVLVGTPVAIATSSPSLTLPLDVILSVAMPLHAHIGMNYVISDYVPKASRGSARNAMLAASVLASLGLLKLSLAGPGLTETLKATWRKPNKGAGGSDSPESE